MVGNLVDILTQATRLADLGSKFRCRSVDHWPVADEGRFGPGKPFLEVGWRHGAKEEKDNIYRITCGVVKGKLTTWRCL